MKKSPVLLFLSLFLFFTCINAVSLFAQANQEKADSLKESINLAQKDTSTVHSIDKLVSILLDLNKLSEGIEWAEKGITLAEEIEFTSGKQRLLINKADHLTSQAEFAKSLEVLEEAELLGTEPDLHFKLLNMRATTNLRMNNNLVAIEIFREMEAIADSTGNLDQLSTAKNNLAVSYANLGERDKALQLYSEALDIAEELGNKPNIAIALNNVGYQFQRGGNSEQAKNYLYRSKELSEELNLQSNLLRVYINLGNSYKDAEDFEKAIAYHQLSLEMRESQQNVPGIIQSKYNIGDVELARENFDLALQNFSEAFDISEEIEFPMGIYYSTTGLGRVERAQQNYDQSIEWFQLGLDAARQMGNKQMVLTMQEFLYETHKLAQRPADALQWLEAYNALSDSLNSEERDRIIVEYEARFGMRESQQQNEVLQARQLQQEAQINTQRWIIVSAIGGVLLLLVVGGFLILNSKKSTRANELLTRKNNELKSLNETIDKQKKELEKANRVKTKLFGIVAHDLRGPTTAMQSLLYLLREHDLSQKDLNDLTADMENSITENATLIDNLLGWAKSQMEGLEVHKKTFNLNMCVRAVTKNFAMRCTEKRIDVSIDVPDHIEIYADYDMIKLIIRNLFANSLKFSKPDSTITITAQSKKNHTQISVTDQGVGIPEEHKSKIFNSIYFSSIGTEDEQGSGLGLNLCKEFVESHGGRIWFQSEVNKQTTFTFEIPNAETISEEKSLHLQKQEA